jgi:uncharacterized protein (DUF433 family)
MTTPDADQIAVKELLAGRPDLTLEEIKDILHWSAWTANNALCALVFSRQVDFQKARV